MHHGCDWQQWWHTATLMAAIVNSQRDPKKKAITPRELHPYENRGQKPGMMRLTKDNMEAFAAMFCDEQQKAAALERAQRETEQVRLLTARLQTG